MTALLFLLAAPLSACHPGPVVVSLVFPLVPAEVRFSVVEIRRDADNGLLSWNAEAVTKITRGDEKAIRRFVAVRLKPHATIGIYAVLMTCGAYRSTTLVDGETALVALLIGHFGGSDG